MKFVTELRFRDLDNMDVYVKQIEPACEKDEYIKYNSNLLKDKDVINNVLIGLIKITLVKYMGLKVDAGHAKQNQLCMIKYSNKFTNDVCTVQFRYVPYKNAVEESLDLADTGININSSSIVTVGTGITDENCMDKIKEVFGKNYIIITLLTKFKRVRKSEINKKGYAGRTLFWEVK